MTARIFSFPGHEEPDTFKLSEAMEIVANTRAPNMKFRKQLMQSALQAAHVAIERENWNVARARVKDTMRLLDRTAPPEKGEAS